MSTLQDKADELLRVSVENIGYQKELGRRIVCVSGYFNPVHFGHIELIRNASQLGDILVVIVNNDRQVKLKKSVPFMSQWDRLIIAQNLRHVDYGVLSIDEGGSVSNTLACLKPDIFANGGDVKSEFECAEQEVCRRLGIQMRFGVGGGSKICSSSDLIRNAYLHMREREIVAGNAA